MLDTEIKDKDLIHLAAYFDSATLLAAAISLDPHEDGDVTRAKASEGTQIAVHLCLKYWKRRKPKEATFQALLTIVRSLGKEDTATSIEEYSKTVFYHANNYFKLLSDDDTSLGPSEKQKLSTTTREPISE